MLLVFAMTIGSTVGVYFGTVYLPQFAAHTGHTSEEQATAQLTVALVVLLLSMIGAGVLSDRFGPLALIRTGFTLLAVTTAPLMVGGSPASSRPPGRAPSSRPACSSARHPVAGPGVPGADPRGARRPASVAIAVWRHAPFVAEWLADHLGPVVG
jgi:MFS family permease